MNGLLQNRVRCGAAVATALCLVALLAAQAQQRKLPPDFEKKRAAIANFESGVVPLFVLGDLNEDGVVDQEDLKLLRSYVTQKNAPGISCIAAGDLDENRALDAKDVELLEQILKRGKVNAPALSSRSRLGCDFKNFFIAARPGAPVGGTVPIHFLDPRFNTQNSSVTVTSGQATVSKGPNEFMVRVGANASGAVTVAISLPGPRRYFYTFPVWPGPR
jgi:dockerin type I repeat protein